MRLARIRAAPCANRHAPHPQDGKAQRPQGRQLRYAPNRYILFLGDEPVAAHFATRSLLQTSAAAAYRQQIERGSNP